NRSDNADATADEVGHERRQAVVFAVQPMVLHRHVLALYVAGFGEAFTERACMARGAIERPTADKADHRHGLLLRARRERPRGCRAAEQRDELAPLHWSLPRLGVHSRSRLERGSDQAAPPLCAS